MSRAPYSRFIGAWQRLAGSLWFLPAILVLLFLAPSMVLIHVSATVDTIALEYFPTLLAASPQSARSVLSAISASVITVARVTFSVMVVAVSQASSQYTPRVLRNFLRDRVSQVTLGVLCGVFVYCLVVLRIIRTGTESFVPAIAVNVAFVLAFCAVALLMYFIHHISTTLEAGSIIAAVSKEAIQAIEELFPEQIGSGPEQEAQRSGIDVEGSWTAVRAQRDGYIQYVDAEGLLRLACEHECTIRMQLGVGEFAAMGQPLAWIDRKRIEDRTAERLRDLFDISTFRTVAQDATFGIRQIADIALKALSPGMNDTTTAASCVRYLTSILSRMIGRRIPSRLRFEGDRLRVIACGPTFESMLDESFDEIRRAAAHNPRILVLLACSLEMLAERAGTSQRRAHVERHLGLVRKTVRADPGIEAECQEGLAACGRVLQDGR